MFAVRNHQSGIQRLVAACDEDLVGTKYDEGDLQLDVSEGFYDGMRVDEADLKRFLQQCTMANLVGEATIAVGIELGMIDPAQVRTIGGVPHAQYITILP